MTEPVQREISNSKVRVLLGGKDILLDSEDLFFKNLPSNKFIRIQNEEYPFLPAAGELFTHFNLEVSHHIMGETYVLPRIVESGYFDGVNEKLPLLSFENAHCALCIEVREHLNYADLKKEDFAYSLATIKNVEALKQVILKRYAQSMPHLSKEKILSLGVSKTTLKIISVTERVD